MDIIEVSSEYKDFKYLASLFDEDLLKNNKSEIDKYSVYSSIEKMDRIVVGYQDGEPVACGAYKEYNNKSTELKRMFVLKDCRQKGYCCKILHSLEQRCYDLGYSSLILETGHNQQEAINFYLKNGFSIIDNYKPYEEMQNSICMEKIIINLIDNHS